MKEILTTEDIKKMVDNHKKKLNKNTEYTFLNTNDEEEPLSKTKEEVIDEIGLISIDSDPKDEDNHSIEQYKKDITLTEEENDELDSENIDSLRKEVLHLDI